MRISPVSVDQILAGRDGRRYLVDGAAGEFAKQLQEVDGSLFLEFNEGGMFYVIGQVVPDGPKKGEEQVVMRVQQGELDRRVLENLRMRNWELRHGINPMDRVEAEEAQLKADAEYARDQEVRERAQPLFHALQREVVGSKPRISVPRAA